MHTSSYDMSEDAQGNLWIATGYGLARLDKRENTITKYLPAVNDAASLIHDNTNCVAIDKTGNLWIGTQSGISILNPTQNLIRYYRNLSQVPHSLNHNHVSSFLEDRTGEIWIGTRGGGLNRFNKQNDRFVSYTRNEDIAHSISSNQVSSLFEDEKGFIWTGLWQGVGFNRFDPYNQTFTHFALDSSSLKSDWYNGFESIGHDTLLVAFWGSEGLRLFDTRNYKWLDHSFMPGYHPTDKALYNIVEYDGKLWMNDKANKIYAFDPVAETFKAFLPNIYHEYNQRAKVKTLSLPDISQIQSITRDQHALWFLTNTKLIRYDSISGVFAANQSGNYTTYAPARKEDERYLAGSEGLHVYNTAKDEASLIIKDEDLPTPGSIIYDIKPVSATKVLLGTSAGIWIFNPENNSISNTGSMFTSLNPTPVRQIETGADSTIIFVFERGMAMIDKENNLQVFNTGKSFDIGMRDDAINYVYRSATYPGFWIGIDKGLYRFSTKNKFFEEISAFRGLSVHQITRFKACLFITTNKGLMKMHEKSHKIVSYNRPPNDMLSSHLISFVRKDRQNRLWAGTTDNGLNRINLRTLKITHFLPGDNFHGSDALAFLETSEGVIYAGGDSLNVFNPAKETFELSTVADQLPQGKVQSLIEDQKHRILIITTHHITILDPRTQKLFNLTPYLGIDNITFTGAQLKTTENEIYVGTVNGFFRFDPELLSPPQIDKNTLVTKVNIMGEPFEGGIIMQEGLKVNYNENFVQFFFSDMIYPAKHDLYLYKLEGIDPEWTSTQEATAIYKMLPPGHYTFKVKASNQFGKSITAHLPLIIRPPFWLTWWFILIGLSVLFASAWIWWKYRLQHLKVIENNLQLRHRLLLSQMNPHFIFNALTAIQSFIYQKQPKAAGSYLSKFAKLMRLYLNNMATPVTLIEDEINTLKYYLELQKLRFNNAFNYSVQTTPDRGMPTLGIPAMMVQPFVENAVEHGVKDVSYEGNIEVWFTLKNNIWEIVIRDNGIGMGNGVRKKNEGISEHKSRSTNIARDRLSQLSRQYRQNCRITIRDITREPGSDTGTEITLVLPVIDINHEQKHKNTP